MSDISEKALAISVIYLGPAAKVFLQRQTKIHMQGLEFDNLKKENIPELAKWVNISASLLIDKNKALELSEKIRAVQ